MLRAAIWSISLGITGVVAFAFHFSSTQAYGPTRDAWETAASEHIAVFESRFPLEDFDSFDGRFVGMTGVTGRTISAVKTERVLPRNSGATETELQVGPLPHAAPKSASPAAGPPMPEFATTARPVPEGHRAASARRVSVGPQGKTNKTAVYDIGAQVVYLPDGRRLEAHSGLGSYMDNARYVNIKNKGPTPPNTYRLVLRENLFHGVQAIRLIPIGDGDMFGRDGMLAHHYLLGPNGQSNGCVSFADYPQFLSAYLNGDIDRLVVVERLESPPGPVIAATWFRTAIKGLLKTFERGSGT